jgi:hypothetical protein
MLGGQVAEIELQIVLVGDAEPALDRPKAPCNQNRMPGFVRLQGIQSIRL